MKDRKNLDRTLAFRVPSSFARARLVHLDHNCLSLSPPPPSYNADIVFPSTSQGAGNALYPIYQANENPELSIHGFDYSKSAIDVVKVRTRYDASFPSLHPFLILLALRSCVQENPIYTASHIGKVNAAVWDLSSPSIPDCIEPGTVDIAVMVFVLSALRPGEEWERAMGNVWRVSTIITYSYLCRRRSRRRVKLIGFSLTLSFTDAETRRNGSPSRLRTT